MDLCLVDVKLLIGSGSEILTIPLRSMIYCINEVTITFWWYLIIY